ncbi:MAG: peptide chain release factor N(5)-glutamine methyltransferase [Desulfofustis sp. PB-SRB1]|nr:peptide chain release factor N(5)-glutamine methyltransferase [Desulfofustis sp. PB-SRB1]MBM1003627.1 peptide chain release factor N(5)-glutamine methyltransferase [Desulfofustis sp. PB-SRB1]HBH29422.1 peptide chain release factor N(5)-glutamine methyltransferase [Desulfofustis sp.]
MTVTDALAAAARELGANGVTGAQRDAELLLAHILNTSVSHLYLHRERAVGVEELIKFATLVQRRSRREPLAYILGEWEFWSLPFTVTPDVLIPRPETEFLLELVFKRADPKNFRICLDLCCGSGVIGIVIARQMALPVIGVDISRTALEVARHNAVRHEVDELVSFVQADAGSCFGARSEISLIVANPPYVTLAEWNELAPEITSYEPSQALFGGASGMTVIERVVEAADALLAPGGELFMEIGAEQADQVLQLCASTWPDFTCDRFIEQDYAGRDRVLHVRRT